VFPANIQTEIDDAAGWEANLQRGWPDAVQLRVWRQSIWYELPYLFLPAFPQVTLADVRPLALFGRLLASSMFVHDPLADREIAVHDAATATLRIMAMQFEAYHALHGCVPARARFWDRLRSYLADYAEACTSELRVSAGAIPWCEFDDALALRIMTGKSGASRAIVAGLAELAHDDGPLEPLITSLDHFNIACQLWDDLKDWRDDLQHAMPSMLLARVLPEHPRTCEDAREPDRVGRMLYYDGHARAVLELALASLDAAERASEPFGVQAFHRLIALTRRRIEPTLHDLNRLVERNVERAVARPAHAQLDLTSRWQSLAWWGAQLLVRACQGKVDLSDPLLRIHVVDALSDVADGLGGELDALLRAQRTHIAAADLVEVDVIAGAVRVALRADRGASTLERCDPLVDRLAREPALTSGAIDPAARGDASTDVVAEVVATLQAYDTTRFAERIQRGCAYLEHRQRPDGAWDGRPIRGPYHVTYACVRTLATCCPGSRAPERALAYLRTCQHADGGWGHPSASSDPQSTALALLGLAAGAPRWSQPDDHDRAARALQFLGSARAVDGVWAAPSKAGDATFEGSETVTTALVVKAAIAWHSRWTASRGERSA
jgi:hypothetical protein